MKIGLLVAAAVFLAACGSSSNNNGGGGAPAKTSSSSGKLTLGTANGADGTYLTDGSGRALYLWVADGDGKSTCTGACATAWPPLTAKGTPAVSGGVHASDVSTITRSGGATQVAYMGHPLYYYAGDGSPGQTTGQGSDGFGAKWWLVAPSGAAITQSAPSGGGDAAGAYG
jgi:predicted lipoprotein with Yx(FWY)xxD motif